MERQQPPRSPTPSDVGNASTYVREVVQLVGRRLAGGSGGLAGPEIEALRSAGSAAAEQGLSAVDVIDMYLSATALLWGSAGPATGTATAVRETPMETIRAGIPALLEGYQNAGRRLIRQEETVRQEFVDDLLRGDADVAGLVQRAEPFGLDLVASHQVVLAGPRDEGEVDAFDEATLSRAVLAQYGDRDTLVTTRSSRLVALVPITTADTDVDAPARLLHQVLTRSRSRKAWRVGVGRPYAGTSGVARSYQEAREAIGLIERLHPAADLIPTRDLLIYRVLGRDRAALADLVENVLTPLGQARGGARPLVDTLESYFAAGAVATEAARRLHMSVRAVTYRLARVSSLTGYDPAVATDRLTLHAAVIGARLLPWEGLDM